MNNFEKEINELWKSNSKIPFMQSKEILGLGYLTAANKYINKQTVNNEENTKVKSPVISSDNNEPQKEYSVNKNKDEMKTAKFSKKSKSEDYYAQKINDKTIELRTLENVLAYIKKSGHLLDTYNYIDNKVQNLKNEIGVSY